MIQFRRATVRDIEILAQLRIDFMREVNGSVNYEDELKYEILLKANIDYFKENISNDQFIAWIALSNEEVVATSGLVFYNRPPSFKNLSGKVAYVMNIYTLSKYRKQGLADELLNRTITEAIGLGYETITLNATEMGRTLYLKHGFRDVEGEMVLNIKDTK